jgi:anaerobic selenocysteine-containing dehydrogenase
VPEEPFVPGEESWHASTCFECAAGCGTRVRKIDGRLVKVEGNPEHPLSRGGLCARGQALPQAMYHPDRFRTPLVREGDRGSGIWKEVGWDEALGRVATELSGIRRKDALGFVTDSTTGHRLEMVRRFLAAAGGGVHLVHDPFTTAAVARAHRRLAGVTGGIGCGIDRARYVVSFGAELLESHVSPVRFARGLAEMRRGRPGHRGKLVMVGPRLSLTAAKADTWIPVRPGDELLVAQAILAIVLDSGLYDRDFVARSTSGFDAFRDFVAGNVEPATVAECVGWPLSKLEQIAREFAANRPAVAFAGGAALRSAQGFALAVTVSHLNALVGAFGDDGLMQGDTDTEAAFSAWPPVAMESVTTRSLAESALSVLPPALFVSGANPLYNLPPGFAFEEKLSDVELIVSFQSFPDETSRFADVILPESMSFERFEDAVPKGGSSTVVNLSAPLLVRPLYDTRSMPDALIALAGRLDAGDAFPWESHEQALRQAWAGLGVSWDEAIANGGHWPQAESPTPFPNNYRFELEPIEAASTLTPAPSGLSLHVYAANAFGDGRSAHLPFLQELADPITGVRWGSVVEIAESTAEELGIRNGDRVEVRNGSRSVTVPAHVSQGIHPGVVAIAAGQGHTAHGRYAEGRGVNVYSLLDATADDDGFLLSAPRVEIRKVTKA